MSKFNFFSIICFFILSLNGAQEIAKPANFLIKTEDQNILANCLLIKELRVLIGSYFSPWEKIKSFRINKFENLAYISNNELIVSELSDTCGELEIYKIRCYKNNQKSNKWLRKDRSENSKGLRPETLRMEALRNLMLKNKNHYHQVPNFELEWYGDNICITNKLTGIKKELQSKNDAFSEVTLSPDGKYLIALGYADEAQILNLQDFKFITKDDIELLEQARIVRYIPNSKQFILANDAGDIYFYNTETLKVEHKIKLSACSSLYEKDFSISPDGQYFAVASDAGNKKTDKIVTIYQKSPDLELI
jgi:WD40 repeat protein